MLPELGRVLALPVLPLSAIWTGWCPGWPGPFGTEHQLLLLSGLAAVRLCPAAPGAAVPGKKGWKTPVCACLAALCASLLFHARSFQAGDMTAAVLMWGRGRAS